jgi:hypothetical protein
LLECWDNEPDNHPSTHEVVEKLRAFILNSTSTTIVHQDDITDHMPNENKENLALLQWELYQIVVNLNKINIKDPKYRASDTITNKLISANVPSGKDLSAAVMRIYDLVYKETDEGVLSSSKNAFIDYFFGNDLNIYEIYNWLLNNQTSPEFIFVLGYLYYTGEVIKKDKEKAFTLFVSASEQDDSLAQYHVGRCYELGNGITKNDELAFQYYKKLADKGYAFGQIKVGECYANGNGVIQDYEVAALWYEKAANNGQLVAMHNMGYLYLNGVGVDKDLQKAFEYYKKSAEGGYKCGIVMLGSCYENGFGTNIDKKKGI